VALVARVFGAVLKLSPALNRDVTVHRDVAVAAADGTPLLADLYQARTQDPQPTVLIRSPYGRRGYHGLAARMFAERGYHVLVQSTRGTSGSGGTIDFDAEAGDGRATADWITGQPWSNGELGTFGSSYLSFTQYALASTRPPQLKAMAIAVWGADLLARKEKLGMLADWRHMLVPLLPGTGVLALLVMSGHDLGTTFILLIIFLALLWFIGTPGRVFAGILIFMLLVLLLLAVTESYRVKRLTGFWDTTGSSSSSVTWQSTQGKYALGSGGIFGVGLGASREKWGWLPESTSDFIFAIIGEELGLVGTLCVTALYGGLAFAGLRVARRAPDSFSRLLSATITVWIVGQAVVNIGAVIGVFPITGVPLPLVSQGLSSVLVTMVGLGMLMSFARREPGASQALAASGPSPGGRALSWLRQGTRRGTLAGHRRDVRQPGDK